MLRDFYTFYSNAKQKINRLNEQTHTTNKEKETRIMNKETGIHICKTPFDNGMMNATVLGTHMNTCKLK